MPLWRFSHDVLASKLSNDAARQNHQGVHFGVCSVCSKQRNGQESQGCIAMFQCQMQFCRRWYHATCLISVNHLLFTPKCDFTNSLLVCTEHLWEGGPDEVSQALQTPEKFNTATQQKPTNLAGSMESGDSEPGRSLDTITALEQNQALQTPQPECRFSEKVASSQSTDMTIQRQGEFLPARDERYQCCDPSLVKDLAQRLHKSISEYDLEIWETIKQFGDIKDRDLIRNPLNSWSSFDNRMSIIAGQQWFQVEGGDNKPVEEPLTYYRVPEKDAKHPQRYAPQD